MNRYENKESKIPRPILAALFFGLFVLSATLIQKHENDWKRRQPCALYSAGEKFDGGLTEPAYRVVNVRPEIEKVTVMYTDLGYSGKIDCLQ